jgi:cytochrome c oxidase subunit 2
MNVPSVLSPESPQARDIVHLMGIVLVVAIIVLGTVAGLVVTSVIRFRRRREGDMPVQDPGNPRLEIVWTVVPLLILTVLFGASVRVMHLVQPPERDREPDMEVVAHQWWWEGHYPASGVVTANEFHLPVGRTLLMAFRSDDVIHDWWVPELGRKVDIFPNRTTYLWTKIEKPGTYLGTCDEFCGAEHAWMRIRVVAQTPDDFDAWTDANLEPASAPRDRRSVEGLSLFTSYTCVSCHTIRGIASGTVGPDLTHVAGRTTLAAGVLENTLGNMTRWIHDPQAIKPGCNMPSMGLTVEQSRKIAEYLEGLQ